jgi:hypothetical protein
MIYRSSLLPLPLLLLPLLLLPLLLLLLWYYCSSACWVSCGSSRTLEQILHINTAQTTCWWW